MQHSKISLAASRTLLATALAVLCHVALPVSARAADTEYEYKYAEYSHGAVAKNTNHARTTWWYGCVPTSVGMMLSYYDRNGYKNGYYQDLIPGGKPARDSTLGDSTDNILKAAIATREHQYDFYGHIDGSSSRAGFVYDTNGSAEAGYTNDDLAIPRDTSEYNCIADFLGTSQWSNGNANGETKIHGMARDQTYTSKKVTLTDIEAWGKQWDSMLWGIEQYVQYVSNGKYNTLDAFTQYVDEVLTPQERTDYGNGFTFEDFTHHIDHGRTVLVHFDQGHTMFAYGYNTGTDGTRNKILLRNALDGDVTRLKWTKNYTDYGFDTAIESVTVFGMTGGETPEPATWALLIVLLLLARRRQRHHTRHAHP